MKSIVSLIRFFVPLMLIFGVAGACKKDDDCNESIECCTWTDSFGDSYSYCRDTPIWATYYSSWEDVVNEAHSYGGNCTCD